MVWSCWSCASHEAAVESDVISVLYCSLWRTGLELKYLKIWTSFFNICEPNSVCSTELHLLYYRSTLVIVQFLKPGTWHALRWHVPEKGETRWQYELFSTHPGFWVLNKNLSHSGNCICTFEMLLPWQKYLWLKSEMWSPHSLYQELLCRDKFGLGKNYKLKFEAIGKILGTCPAGSSYIVLAQLSPQP